MTTNLITKPRNSRTAKGLKLRGATRTDKRLRRDTFQESRRFDDGKHDIGYFGDRPHENRQRIIADELAAYTSDVEPKPVPKPRRRNSKPFTSQSADWGIPRSARLAKKADRRPKFDADGRKIIYVEPKFDAFHLTTHGRRGGICV